MSGLRRAARGVAAVVLLPLLGAYALEREAVHEPGLVDKVRTLTVAVIHGDLPAAAGAADWIGRHAAPIAGGGKAAGAELEPLSTAMREGAAAFSTIKDVAAAAAQTASLLSACADCHERAGVSPALPRETSADPRSVTGHMRGHQEAADLLLEGIIAPSGEAWSRGARQLETSPLRSGDFPVSTRIGGMMAAVETRLHALAGAAATAPDRAARQSVYAELLTTCAGCHTRHTTLWDMPKK